MKRKLITTVITLIGLSSVIFLACALKWLGRCRYLGDGCNEVVFTEVDEGLLCLACSPTERIAVTGSSRGTVTVWDLARKQVLRILPGHDEAVNSVAFMADGRILASGSGDGVIKTWDTITWREKQTFQTGAGVQSVVFSP